MVLHSDKCGEVAGIVSEEERALVAFFSRNLKWQVDTSKRYGRQRIAIHILSKESQVKKFAKERGMAIQFYILQILHERLAAQILPAKSCRPPP